MSKYLALFCFLFYYSPSYGQLDYSPTIVKKSLDNGLTVLIVENKDLPIFSYYTYYDVGGRYESEGTTGATHFLEHMMFKGAKKYGPGQFDGYIESIGGSTNAYTTFDQTVYYQYLPTTALEKIIDMEADRIQNLLLEKVSFDNEKQVVLEERKMRYENRPEGKIFLATMKEVFRGTPYGGSVIGEKKDVEGLNPDQMRVFFDRFYTPDNATIVIVGDVDADEVISQIKEKFGQLKSSKDLKDYKKKMDAPERFKGSPRNITIKVNGSSPTPMFRLGFRSEKMGEDKSFLYDLLSGILGQGESSFLTNQYIKNKAPVLSEVFAFNYTLLHAGGFFVGGQLLPKVSIEGFEKRLRKDLAKACNDHIDERSLQKAKNQLMVGYFRNLETNSGVATLIGDSEYYFKDPYYFKKALTVYEKATVKEMKEACTELFKSPGVYVSLWNKHPNK